MGRTPRVGRRPALVLTRQGAIDNLNEIFLALATTTIRGLPTEVELGPDDGMPRTCVLNLDHTDTVGKGHLTERITSLGLPDWTKSAGALGAATGC